ncbi:isocitrate lyase/PEP mutase family protein [Roseitranquillus sediminis]|uniref:isocitrate lyase/PEP mutase family protein n=1 Tax=Roseitranquillus sediminis TaxID=2809051 RepID=UPI001D0CA99B|nr:isocitrate lyase/PEP mutase family protein [Roseitranquillus sediminis]MBM9593854.1 isocitrate lyase/PEP mutase family protein [Roseitranquillus sediminis]
MRQTTKLKQLMQRRDAVIVPGVANAMFARIVERQGFEAVYVTGAGVANMHLGAPDIGLTTVTELGEITAAISDATPLPLIVDGDTGFGNALNVVRTVRLLERAGASGIQLEDQVFPKRCGHFAGKEVIPASEMVQKIKAAVDARQDGDLQIIARTDARAVDGFEAAIERAEAFVEAGADVTFVEAPLDEDELAAIPRRLPVPQLANMVHGGRTPDPGPGRLREMGFSVALYANAVLQATIRGANEVLTHLRETGSLAGGEHLLAGFEERQTTVDKERWDALDERYRKSGD